VCHSAHTFLVSGQVSVCFPQHHEHLFTHTLNAWWQVHFPGPIDGGIEDSRNVLELLGVTRDMAVATMAVFGPPVQDTFFIFVDLPQPKYLPGHVGHHTMSYLPCTQVSSPTSTLMPSGRVFNPGRLWVSKPQVRNTAVVCFIGKEAGSRRKPQNLQLQRCFIPMRHWNHKTTN
jgi:hypothetical protein